MADIRKHTDERSGEKSTLSRDIHRALDNVDRLLQHPSMKCCAEVFDAFSRLRMLVNQALEHAENKGS